MFMRHGKLHARQLPLTLAGTNRCVCGNEEDEEEENKLLCSSFLCFFFLLLSSHIISRSKTHGGSFANKWEKQATTKNAFTKINSSCTRYLHYSTLCNWRVKVIHVPQSVHTHTHNSIDISIYSNVMEYHDRHTHRCLTG